MAVSTGSTTRGDGLWSQRYTDFEQILPPRTTLTFPQPDAGPGPSASAPTPLQHFIGEKEIPAISPGVPVTTNFMSMTGFRHLDYHQWAPHQDIVSTDHHLVNTATWGRFQPFRADVTRGLANGRRLLGALGPAR